MKLSSKIFTLLLGPVLLLSPALAAPPNDANGAAPRPVYIMANNPNNLADIADALSRGCNALEPDVAVGTDGLLRDYDTSSPYRNAGPGDTLFTDWLQGLHNLVQPGGQYAGRCAFITFDCKSDIPFSSGEALTILNDVRTILNTNGVAIPFVLNVGHTADVGSGFYDTVFPLLGPLEGVQCDDSVDVGTEFPLFRSRGYVANVTWGTGGQQYETLGSGWGPLDHGAFTRAQYGFPKAIPYLFDYSDAGDISELFNSGADGVICNDGAAVIGWIESWAANPAIVGQNPPFSYGYAAIQNAVTAVNSRHDIRLATPSDNPFQPKGESYALYITTANVLDAGTDAKITITINGANGSSSLTVDTSRTGRMEQGDINYVTIPSKDLGALTSLTIYNDGSGSGPGWNCSSIQVSSARWLGVASTTAFYTAAPGEINGGQSVTVPLTGSNLGNGNADQYANSAVPANTSTNPTGELATPWQDFYTAYNFLFSNGTLHLGSQNYIVGSGVPGTSGRIDKPCRIVKEPTYQFGNARLIAN